MLANGQVKVCTRCREEKLVEEFGKDGGREDGRTIYCRHCRRLRYAEDRGAGKIIRDGVVVRTPPTTRDCPQCGATFRPRHSDQRFCGRLCVTGSRRKPNTRPRNPRPYVSQRMADRQPKACETCGFAFIPLTAVSRFCSVRCKAAAALGNVMVADDGYRLVRVPKGTPGRYANGYILEHRHVLAQVLGRPLTKDESVHHINGDRADNRLENLQLRVGKHGSKQAFRCRDCGSQNVEPITL